ncbi:MAG TPA: hypothetical protein VFS43_31230 [Polyangiaceae bacterium]|nr:hypothetical protein [Polyangiaceae bacterium]
MNLRTLSVAACLSSALTALACGGEGNPPPASPAAANDPNGPAERGNTPAGGIGSPDPGANPATPVGTSMSSPQTPGGIGATPSGHFGGPNSPSGVTPGGATSPLGAGGAGGSAGKR